MMHGACGNDSHDADRQELRKHLDILARRIGLPVPMTIALADDATMSHHTYGNVIFSPRSQDVFSYVVVRGTVRLECIDHWNDPVGLQYVRAGRLFGVCWLADPRPRAIRAVAQSDVTTAVLSQQTIARFERMLPEAARMNLFSYAARAQSAIVVQKCAERSLDVDGRLICFLRNAAPDFGRREGDWIVFENQWTSKELGVMIAADEGSIRHAFHRRRDIRRDNGTIWCRASADTAAFPGETTYRGTPAPWARADLGRLLRGCGHLQLSDRSAEFIHRTADLYAVPDGEILLPPGQNAVAFVVAGSAWLEGAGTSGRAFPIQLVPRGRFVRLPTGASSRGFRMQGRAHRQCVVGILTSEQMSEAMSYLSGDAARRLHDVTSRGLSRHLCDNATAPTRTRTCRLLSAFGFLAHDFGGRFFNGVPINVLLSRVDLAYLIDSDRATVSKALKRLTTDGWVDQLPDGRYLLLKAPPAHWSADATCDYCSS